MPSSRSLTVLNGHLNVHLLPSAPYSACDPVQSQALGVALERQTGVHAIDSDHRVDFDTWPGVLTYTPAGLPVFSESQTGGEYLVARWTRPVTTDDATALPNFRKEMPGHRQALVLGRAIRKAMMDPDIDTLALEELAVQFVSLCAVPRSAPRNIDRASCARVLDRIAAEFDQPLTLSQLASAEGVAEVHFLREFSRVVGMTPHAFIVETRLQAARALIERTDMPLAMIALECGFSHQSHMGTAFRNLLGLTPLRYRSSFRDCGLAAPSAVRSRDTD
jgi:AraC-like DNA-binding protein